MENAFLLVSRSLPLIAIMAAVGCAREAPRHVLASDDFGDVIVVSPVPRRIVSLNPATTDLVFALGAGSRLVGRTHWDLYPDSARYVPDLGSGIRPNVEAVLGARPDLVLLYASNDNRAAASELRAAGVKTLSLKIDRIADFDRAARILGRVLGDSARGAIVADSVALSLQRVRRMTSGLAAPRVLWHIWDAPLITIGRGSYLNELIEIAGGRNVYGDVADPSPTISVEDALRRDPDAIIAGPEGAAHIRSDPRWMTSRAVRTGKVLVVDTTLVGRPSVKMGAAALSIAKLLHPMELR